MLVELYDPRDGSDIGVPLPERVYRRACVYDGMQITAPYGLQLVAKLLQEAAGEGIWQADIYCDLIALTHLHPNGTPLNHWRVIKFREVKDAATGGQTD